jgi:hypothetical protein
VGRRFQSPTSSTEDFAVAETTKLSVGQALDKMRGTDVPASKMASLDEKIEALNEETRRLRATRLRVERDQRGSSIGRDAQKEDTGRITKLKLSGIIIGIVIVIAVLVWTCWLFWK